MVAWMSGLVTGLQNRAQRFESASDLQQMNRQPHGWRFFFVQRGKSSSDTLTMPMIAHLALCHGLGGISC